jgi:hypothetical protein
LRNTRSSSGYHFANPALRDGVVEPERPEVLVYEKRPDGTFKFNGVEYLVSFSDWKRMGPPTVMGQKLERAESLGFRRDTKSRDHVQPYR